MEPGGQASNNFRRRCETMTGPRGGRLQLCS
jgi:hypothetical protein